MCARAAGGLGYFRNAGPWEQPGGRGLSDFGRSVNPIQSLNFRQGGHIVPITLLLASEFPDIPTNLRNVVLGDLHFTIDE